MKIGLVRHFKVTFKPERSWMTSEQFDQWVEDYNNSDIEPMALIGDNLNWDLCLSSDLLRASRTAELIFPGAIIKGPQLREIRIRSAFTSHIKLHYMIWLILGRIAWHFSHRSQGESRIGSLARAKQVIDRIEASGQSHILVVTHGMFMKSLRKELIRRGYTGKTFLKPKNGKLYVLCKN